MSQKAINDMMTLFQNLSLEPGEYDIQDLVDGMRQMDIDPVGKEVSELSSNMSSLLLRKPVDEIDVLAETFSKLEIRDDSITLQRKDGVRFTFYWVGGCRAEAEPWRDRIPRWGY